MFDSRSRSERSLSEGTSKVLTGATWSRLRVLTGLWLQAAAAQRRFPCSHPARAARVCARRLPGPQAGSGSSPRLTGLAPKLGSWGAEPRRCFTAVPRRRGLGSSQSRGAALGAQKPCEPAVPSPSASGRARHPLPAPSLGLGAVRVSWTEKENSHA